nr:hypothetical protein CDL12_18591 [Ipomoea trifida]
MRVRITPRLLVRVVSGKRNYEHQSGGGGDGDGDGIIRGRKNMNGWVLWINNTLFCSSTSTKAAEEEEEEEEVEVASSSSNGRKINMFKEVVGHRLRRIFVPHGKSKKIALGKQKLGRSFKCLVSRFSGMFRLKKKKGGFRLRKWKKKIRMRKSTSIGAVKKRFARIRSCRIRKEEEIELCKKRILMGEKCKPLNVSGSLHYDQNGVLLPEPLLLLPFPCE